jgi:hypothetical protein
MRNATNQPISDHIDKSKKDIAHNKASVQKDLAEQTGTE